MNIGMILDMAASAGSRSVITVDDRSLSAADLLDRARRAAPRFHEHPAVLYLGTNHLAYPVALFGAVLAGVPFVPLNYRLGDAQLSALLERHPGALILRPEDLDALVAVDPAQPGPLELPTPWDADSVAVILYTSGTTSAPKAALLRHRHLMAYLLNTVEFGAAATTDATLVSVPPYHIAGLTNLLEPLRRTPGGLPVRVRPRRVAGDRSPGTDHAGDAGADHAGPHRRRGRGPDAGTPTLATLAYGGSRMPRPVLDRALRVFPETGFVNAYGLTETASSVAVLGPEDHRAAATSDDPLVRDRLGSVGRPLPGIEFEIRSAANEPVAVGEPGLVFVRGEQISGEYGGRSALDADGWFPTGDLGKLDDAGYLFIEGRADDTIIRGGENIAPAEIEDVLLEYPGITEAAVVGVPDPEWGQRLVAVVVGVGDEARIKQWVKERLRSSKTPDVIVFRTELPKTDTGKLLRRNLVAELEDTRA